MLDHYTSSLFDGVVLYFKNRRTVCSWWCVRCPGRRLVTLHTLTNHPYSVCPISREKESIINRNLSDQSWTKSLSFRLLLRNRCWQYCNYEDAIFENGILLDTGICVWLYRSWVLDPRIPLVQIKSRGYWKYTSFDHQTKKNNFPAS